MQTQVYVDKYRQSILHYNKADKLKYPLKRFTNERCLATGKFSHLQGLPQILKNPERVAPTIRGKVFQTSLGKLKDQNHKTEAQFPSTKLDF